MAPRFSVKCYCSMLTWRLFEIALVLLMRIEPLVALLNWVFSLLCCCQGGGFLFILRELIFDTVVLHQLLLQHADLTIIWDSPRVADADRATGRVVELSFQLAVLLPRRRIFIYFTFATPRFSHIVFVLISNCFTEVPQIPIHVTIYGCWWDTQALS